MHKPVYVKMVIRRYHGWAARLVKPAMNSTTSFSHPTLSASLSLVPGISHCTSCASSSKCTMILVPPVCFFCLWALFVSLGKEYPSKYSHSARPFSSSLPNQGEEIPSAFGQFVSQNTGCLFGSVWPPVWQFCGVIHWHRCLQSWALRT